MPNHALIVLALLYSGGDFHRAMTIVNTSGWDTDCNSGNVGCLIGVMHGLKGLEGGPDWRGPLADRALISASDGGYAVNDAARLACDIASLGRQLAGLRSAVAAEGRRAVSFRPSRQRAGFHRRARRHPKRSHCGRARRGRWAAGAGAALQGAGLWAVGEPR